MNNKSEEKKEYKWYQVTGPDGRTWKHPSTEEYMKEVFSVPGYSYIETDEPELDEVGMLTL